MFKKNPEAKDSKATEADQLADFKSALARYGCSERAIDEAIDNLLRGHLWQPENTRQRGSQLLMGLLAKLPEAGDRLLYHVTTLFSMAATFVRFGFSEGEGAEENEQALVEVIKAAVARYPQKVALNNFMSALVSLKTNDLLKGAAGSENRNALLRLVCIEQDDRPGFFSASLSSLKYGGLLDGKDGEANRQLCIRASKEFYPDVFDAIERLAFLDQLNDRTRQGIDEALKARRNPLIVVAFEQMRKAGLMDHPREAERYQRTLYQAVDQGHQPLDLASAWIKRHLKRLEAGFFSPEDEKAPAEASKTKSQLPERKKL